MKFSHSINFNAVPEWTSHYLAYSNLKKVLYSLEKTANQAAAAARGAGDLETQPLVRHDDPEFVFSRALDVELEKISSFYGVKEKELMDEADEVLRDLGAFNSGGEEEQQEENGYRQPPPPHQPRPSAHPGAERVRFSGVPESSARSQASTETGVDDSDDDADETTGLARNNSNKSRPSTARRHNRPAVPNSMLASTDLTASTSFTRSVRRRSDAAFDNYAEQAALFSSAIMLKKSIVSLYVQLCELKSYAQLNREGFRKVLKKFDKILDRSLRQPYMDSQVDTAYPFRPESTKALDGRIAAMVTAYANVVTKGDEAAARRDLRSHLREHVVWERNTVWRDLIGIERRHEAASLGRALLGGGSDSIPKGRLRGDEEGHAAGIGGGGGDDDDKAFSTPLGRISLPGWLFSSAVLTLALVTAVFALLLAVPILDQPEQQNCLAMLVFVSLLWATEAIPLFVTSMLIPLLCVVLRVVRAPEPPQERLSAADATHFIFSAMWTPVIMLLLGGFTIAAALSKCKIDKRIATFVLSKAGTQPRTVLLANMLVAAVASMLISNVAAPVLCFGIIEPMLRNLPAGSDMSRALIMGIALASNIGGMLSPIASPQNVVAISIMEPPPSWGDWLFICLPVGIVSILLIWALLLATFRPGRDTTIVRIRTLRDPFTGLQWFVTLVAVATVALWCGSHALEPVFGDMGVIAVLPIAVLFGAGVLTKEDFNNFPWTIVMLAAGGLALGKAVNSSGLLHAAAAAISRRAAGMPLYGVLVLFSGLTLVVATFISHTVAALIILPLVADVGASLAPEPHPNLLVMASVLMCSAAMALPTSGFPNMTAILKEDPAGQRYLRVRHFISRGVPASLLTMAVVVTLGYGAMRAVGM